ncbi:hypothetical protein SCP_0605200 [Sparassis crispa]|uniref:Uncharacterized protein n=1 Tax=Sparassis crispa TaxID=139825 RepID=A0A401GQM0_9APHY|nr:hypothetical protein SCP_0605200 [Sparassis crispa]GBE84541.1 hypothetical protein SCP_0605200 [Sparassis crispa]
MNELQDPSDLTTRLKGWHSIGEVIQSGSIFNTCTVALGCTTTVLTRGATVRFHEAILVAMTNLLLNPKAQDGYMMPLRSFDKDIRECQEPGAYDKYRLVKVTHYKDVTVIAHEFLVLDIYNSEEVSEGVIHLRIERGATTVKPGEGFSASSKNTLAYVRLTNDKISRDPLFQPSKYFRIAYLRCPPTTIISLPDVCRIFPTLYEGAPNYSLLKNQCYWFCSTFLHGVETDYNLRRIKAEYWMLRGNPGGWLGNLIKLFKLRILRDNRAKEDTDAYIQHGVDEETKAKAAGKAKLDRSLAELVTQQKQKNVGDRDMVNRLLQPSPIGRASP